MSKKNPKPAGKRRPAPAPTNYPAPPHVIGLDWLELAVRDPAASAAVYQSIGFVPRPRVGHRPRVAIGGLVIEFHRAKSNDKPAPRATLQLATDHVNLKHQQLKALGLRPGPLRAQPRGDRGFVWKDADGHAVRFVGPARREDDTPLR